MSRRLSAINALAEAGEDGFGQARGSNVLKADNGHYRRASRPQRMDDMASPACRSTLARAADMASQHSSIEGVSTLQ